MYQEWFDAVPILVNGCYEHNASQLQRAASYWESKGDIKEAEKCRNLAVEELNKAAIEEEKRKSKKWHWWNNF